MTLPKFGNRLPTSDEIAKLNAEGYEVHTWTINGVNYTNFRVKPEPPRLKVYECQGCGAPSETGMSCSYCLRKK